MCTVEFTAGTLGPHSSWASICPSDSSVRKLAFQYCWRPGGSSASNAEFNAGYGMGPLISPTTGPTSRTALMTFGPSSTGPAQHATNATNGSPCRFSGMNGRGGAICHAGNAPSSSGAPAMNPRYHSRSPRASSSSKNMAAP